MWVVSFTPQQLSPRGSSPWVPLNRRLGGLRGGMDAVERRGTAGPEVHLPHCQFRKGLYIMSREGSTIDVTSYGWRTKIWFPTGTEIFSHWQHCGLWRPSSLLPGSLPDCLDLMARLRKRGALSTLCHKSSWLGTYALGCNLVCPLLQHELDVLFGHFLWRLLRSRLFK
jgi:hypothetical protein